MPSVIDINGQVIERFDDFAVPHALSFASLIRGASNTYLHDKWEEALKDSRENAKMMRNDCWLMSLVDERARGVTSSKWELEVDNPADPYQKQVLDGVMRAVKRTPNLKRFIKKLLAGGDWFGRYGCQVRWQWQEIMGERLLCVSGHQPVNGDKIGFQFDATPYILINPSEADQYGPGAEIITTSIYQAITLRGGWRERWLIHKHDPEDADFFDAEDASGVFGYGIRARIYWLDHLRKELESWVTEALERTGLGIVCIKYEQGNVAAKEEAERLAKTYSRRSVITFPVPAGTLNSRVPGGAYGIEVVETPTAGITILEDMKKRLEDKIERYIVGQSASSDSETTGMGTHNTDFQQLTKQELIAEDAEELAETLTGSPREPGLLSIIKRWSYPWADFPLRWVFKIGDPSPEKRMKAFEFAAKMTTLKADEVREVAGASKPAEGDEVCGGPPPAPVMPGVPGTDPAKMPTSSPQAAPKAPVDADRGNGQPGGHPNRIAALLNGGSNGHSNGHTQHARSGSPLYFETHHAPAGGVTLGNKTYVGGEFIPGDQVEKATAEEKKQLTVKRSIPEKIKAAPGQIAAALKPEAIDKAVTAIIDGVKHPAKTASAALDAGKAKLKKVYDEYGAVGVAAVASAYVAYYAAAAANPAMLTVPVPLTATILTCAKLIKSGLKKIKGGRAEYALSTSPDLYERLKSDLAILTDQREADARLVEEARQRATHQREREREQQALLSAIRADDATQEKAERALQNQKQLIEVVRGSQSAIKSDIVEAIKEVKKALPSPIVSSKPVRGADDQITHFVQAHEDGTETIRRVVRDSDGNAVDVVAE